MTCDPLCPHFGDCGGCAAQDVAYPQQLVGKEASLRELLADYWEGPIPVTPSPDLWHYRNKVDPSFARKQYPEPPPKGFQRETVIGFKRKGKWFWTLDIEDCLIAPEGMSELLTSVRQWARANNLTAFSSKSKDGFLRILLVRAGRRTGQRMVVLVTNDGDLDREGFVKAVQDAFPCDSIHWAVFRGMAEIAAADEISLLHGAETIDEILEIPGREAMDPLRFRISPFSFFQTNTLGTERLYGHIREWVADTGASTLYDLYGGAGCIAFTCADLVAQVVSVESVPEATADGEHNAVVNGIGNVTFHTQKVEHYVRDLRDAIGVMAADAACVVDPPRAGLHPKALRRLCDLRPRSLIYVACQPKVFSKQDLPPLLEHYRLTDVRAVDLFPHTPHVELLARFEAREEVS